MSGQATRRLSTALAAGVALLLVACLLSLSVGAAGINIGDVWKEALSRLPGMGRSPLDELSRGVLWDVRFPRVVLSALIGAGLGLCGSAYQGAFRNPLVDPFLLGAAAGAGFGATLAIVYLPSIIDWPIRPLPIAAFIGALTAVAMAYGVGHRAASTGDRRDDARLVLAGVAVASFFTAMQSFVQQRANDNLRIIYAWLLGGLTTSGWRDVLVVLPYLAFAGVVLLLYGRHLDVLSVGDDEARTLGVSPERVRLVVIVAASVGTAACVAVSGLIGFVGLVVPHVVRMAFGSSFRINLPASALFGASFLVLADMAARNVLAPAELPIGVITAFVGAPFFAWLLLRGKRA
jgi:iron complex transport system permease protein